MSRRLRRFALVLAAAVLGGGGLLFVASCAAPPAVRHLAADQDGLTEAGRAMAIAELTANLGQRSAASDPARWRELLTRSGQLSQAAGRFILSRATAVSGSATEAESFYSRLGTDTATLRAQREQLQTDLSEAIKTTAR